MGKDLDPFDLICHVAFDQPPLTRRERAENVRKRNYFTKYGEQARAVLDALLDKYADEGIADIERHRRAEGHAPSTASAPRSRSSSASAASEQYHAAVRELESHLYEAAR